MPLLVRLIHADPSVRPLYESAFRAASLDVDLVFANNFVPGKLSSAYDELATKLRSGGRILPSLRAKHPGPRATYDAEILVSFSAGYKLVQRIVEVPADRAELAGWIGLDSLHTSLDADRTASDAQLVGFVALAKAAREDRALCWIGHSDVATPQTGTGAYASTTQTAQELVRLAGPPTGLFCVRAFNVRDNAHQREEHGQALTGWGPGFVGEALGAWLAARGNRITISQPPPVPATDPAAPAWTDYRLPIGERLRAWYRAELAAGVAEVPLASNTSPRIKVYLAPCRRRETEKLLRLEAGAWCAAMASYGASVVALPGEAYPSPRASGYELELDAKESGTWLAGERVRAEPALLRVGDIGILPRAGESWARHVVIAEELPVGGRWRSLGGNEGDRVQSTERALSEALGFVTLGRRAPGDGAFPSV